MTVKKKLIQKHLKRLCEDIGARPTGSEANKAAVAYAAAELEKIGFEVTLQEFPCLAWKDEGARLEVDGVVVETIAAEYSLPCDVAGEIVYVDTIEGLRASELHRKICIMSGELCEEPLMPKSFTFWNPEKHQEIIRLLEQKEPLAIITVSFLPDVAVPIIQDGDFNIPCAAVKGESDHILREATFAKLQLFTERKESNGKNVIAHYGEGPQKISFSAHIDTKPNTPGALDNASGVAALLVLASSVTNIVTPYQIEIVLFNGEDYYSTPGEKAYMSTYLQEPDKFICAFNVDGLGMQDSKTSYSFYECGEEFEKLVSSFARDFPDVEQIDPWPMGDHMLFAGCGIPTVAVTASNIFMLMESVMHTPADNLTIVDSDKIEAAVSFLLDCI
ncbi:M28 family metallopeptidase [Enterococcus sp. LJL51]|uniref:M28 family metallopeptidase n=1 Tax=Enterococcus sp. LJL51 TaxID=3416656 RepID=UPI003CF4F5DE